METVGPARFDQLLAPHHSQFSVGHVAADRASRSDDRVRPDRDRGDERGVRADEGAILDDGLVLEIAVVIASDGARPDVRIRADLRIAEIGQVAGLGVFAHHGFLDLDEIADLRPALENGTRTQARERSDRAVLSDARAFQMAERLDRRAARYRNAGTEHDIRFHRDVVGQLRIVTEENGVRRAQGHPFRHPVLTLLLLPLRFGRGQLGAAVDAGHFVRGR